MLSSEALAAAGNLAAEIVGRDLAAAFGSAVLAGAAMTLYTWLTVAARGELMKAVVALLVGYLLIAPPLNHAIVATGELLVAAFAGTHPVTVADILGNLAVASAGNFVGGVVFVTGARWLQHRTT